MQVMNRFLNRLPTVTIREGHRVKVYLTSDLELPAFQGGRRAGRILTGGASCRVAQRPSLRSFLPRPRSTPARAQIPVTDVAHLTQAVLIAQSAQRHLDELRAQYRTIMRMSQGLGAMEHYRMPPVGSPDTMPAGGSYAEPWLQRR